MAMSPSPGSEEGKAISMQLIDRGFDVWFTNNRATTYSRKYSKAEPWEQAYWDFSFDDYGKYDNVANMKYIYDYTGGKKVSYYGYSLGTTQAFYSLAKLEDEFFAEHAQAFALVAPCTISEFELWPLFNRVFVTLFETIDVHAFSGPYWYQDLPKLCKKFGKEACGALMMSAYLKDISFKTFFHQAQNTQQRRFQEYSPTYWNVFSEAERITPLIDLSKIKKVPVGMYVGEADVTCPSATAVEAKNQIGDMVKDFVIYPGAGHETFATKVDKEFADRIANLLGYQPEDPMYVQ